MKRQIVLQLLLGSLFMCSGLSLEAKAADYFVTRLDDRNGTCNSGVDCSFREAVKAANSSGTNDDVHFSFGFGPGVAITLDTDIVIANNGTLNIWGPGANSLAISGGGVTRIFTVDGANVTITGLTLKNGTGSGTVVTDVQAGDGGAIAARLGTLTLNSVVLTNNTSSNAGGALFAHGPGTLNIINSTIAANNASGPGFVNFGGGIYVESGTSNISGSTISQNFGGGGGGIYQSGGTMRLSNATISGNTSVSDGGGIELENNAVTQTFMTNVTVTGNKAIKNGPNDTSIGGGVFGTNCDSLNPENSFCLYLRNTIIAGNSADFNADVNRTVYSYGHNLIRNSGPNNMIVTGDTTGNQLNVDPKLGPLADNGGPTQTQALLQGSPAIEAGDDCVLENPGCASSTFTADQRGFARAMDGNGDGTLDIDIGAYEFGALVLNANNTGAGSLRDAISNSLNNGEIVFDQNFFNVPRTITLTSGQYIIDFNLTIHGPGSGLLTLSAVATRHFLVNQTLTLSGVRLTNGHDTAHDGGAIYVTGTLNGTDIVVTGNSANNGGGIFNNGVLNLSNSTISNDSAGSGGGIYNNFSATVTGSTLSGNSAQNGGGVYNNGNSITLTDSAVSGNTASNGGGGIFNAGASGISVVGSTLSNNAANGIGGGGIYNAFSTSMQNTTLSGNSAPNGKGGGVYTFGFSAAAQSVTVTNNSANFGGGVFVECCVGANFNAVNSIFAGNRFTTRGPDFDGSLNSLGYNLIGNTDWTGITGDPTGNLLNVPARLAPLGSYGGPTQTHELSCASPALNAGDPNLSNSLPTDQRGVSRPIGGRSDIGAFEVSAPCSITVANGNANGAGSLPQALTDINFGGTVLFNTSFFSVPRTLNQGLYIDKDLTITGPGANLLTFDANHSFRSLMVDAGATLNLSGMRLTGGMAFSPDVGAGVLVTQGSTLNATGLTVDNATAPGGNGGGFYNLGTLNLTNSTVSANAGVVGGGIYNGGILSMISSTINGCRANFHAGIFNEAGKTATITGSTISGNTTAFNSPNPQGGGGGIGNAGTMTINSTTISGNAATVGSGIYDEGNTTLNNSTVANNSATSQGGGIYINTDVNDATVNTTNTTISANSASDSGGGVYVKQVVPGGGLNLRNTIVAGNTAASSCADVSAGSRMYSYGYNLIGVYGAPCDQWASNSPAEIGDIVNPAGGVRLAPLGNYGGATQTMALLSGYPVSSNSPIDAGDPNNPFTTDQRASTRPIGGRGDIGAFEQDITFDQSTVPTAHAGQSYNGGSGYQLSATRQTSFAASGPGQFSIISGSLPSGMTLSNTGLLSGTPGNTAGMYTFIVRATDTDAMSGAQEFTMQVFGPTAASVPISGRVLTPDGRGLTNAIVLLNDSMGGVRTTRTSAFGYYRFDDVAAGQTCVLSVNSKRYQFGSQFVSVMDAVSDLNFIAR